MLSTMIEAIGLTKRLGGRAVVSDVSFRCEPGTVTGFLGPNGAGKTTTMRMLVGLSAPDGGSSTVLEQDYRRIANPGTEVGVLLDAGAQHPGRRGREALAVSAQMMGVPSARVDELLALVGLDQSAARKRVRQYSLGMRQRLGLAHALLGDPQVLILDEPANGLDPEGALAGFNFQRLEGGLVVEATPEDVGRAALAGQVVLTHLGPSEGAGLEQLFFDLTEAPA
jgi:ABC-2 type transport system ATP-binding protein